MEHAPYLRKLPNHGQTVPVGVPVVDNHRQTQPLCQLQLAAEHLPLKVPGRVLLPVVIQPDLTHGHHRDEAAKTLAPGNILLYGHTHVPDFTETDGVYYVNPGSVSIPKEGSRHSYLLFENGVFTWKDVETGEVWRAERIKA